MRVLSIGTDRNIFEAESAVRVRQEAYAQKLGHLDIVVFSRRSSAYVPFCDEHLSGTPTNSYARFLYGLDAWRVAGTLPKPDVITTQDPFETGFIALCIARWLGVPLHVQVHTDFTAPAFRRHSPMNRLRYTLAWFVLRHATRIRVVLARTKDDLVARGVKVSVTVLPIFVDMARFANLPRLKHPRFKIALLFLGRLEKEKHPCAAIDALAAARAAGHDAGLTIAGEGSEHKVLVQRARRLGLERYVEFVPWQKDITPFLSQADIVLVPSRYEGYGLVIVESLAAGVPVLATDVGVAREAAAIVVAPERFSTELVHWIEKGPRHGTLAAYPYASADEYREQWCADVSAAAKVA